MMKTKVLFLLSVAMICVAALGTSADAAMIRNMTTGELLFYDDFEGVTPVSSAAYPDLTGDYDPDNGAYPGYWTAYDDSHPERVQVTDYSVPGPFEGDQYLRIVGINPTNAGNVAAKLDTVQADNSDVIHIEFMRYVPADIGRPQFYLWGSNAGVTLNLIINYSGNGKLISYIGSDYEITETTYALDKWQKWELDFAVDTATFDLTIDGVSEYGIPRIGSGPFEMAAFYDHDPLRRACQRPGRPG